MTKDLESKKIRRDSKLLNDDIDDVLFRVYISAVPETTTTVMATEAANTTMHSSTTIETQTMTVTTTTQSVFTTVETTTGATVQTVTLVISSPLVRENKSLEWSDSLLDPTSSLFQEYSTEVCDLLIKSMTTADIEGLINVTCTVVSFQRGSVIGNAVLTVQHDISSENFSTSSVTEQTVLAAIVQYTEELVTNGTGQVYFGAASNITIEAVPETTTTVMATEAVNTTMHSSTTTVPETTTTVMATEAVNTTMYSSTTLTTQTTTKATSLTNNINISIRVELRKGNKPLLWDPLLTNNISAVYNATSEKTCALIKAAARFTTSMQFEITFCNILRFYPGSILAEAGITVNYTD
uniref:SEA domain-containing protein n=1 Tax=Trichobilharzia regenti TaxID=157069 RepID=A0AA85JCV0_TRIRE